MGLENRLYDMAEEDHKAPHLTPHNIEDFARPVQKLYKKIVEEVDPDLADKNMERHQKAMHGVSDKYGGLIGKTYDRIDDFVKDARDAAGAYLKEAKSPHYTDDKAALEQHLKEFIAYADKNDPELKGKVRAYLKGGQAQKVFQKMADYHALRETQAKIEQTISDHLADVENNPNAYIGLQVAHQKHMRPDKSVDPSDILPNATHESISAQLAQDYHEIAADKKREKELEEKYEKKAA